MQAPKTYHKRCQAFGDIPLPNHIPASLSVFEKRKTVNPDEWSDAGAIWIQSWYGNEAPLNDVSPNESVTRENADKTYSWLYNAASAPYESGSTNFGSFVFDDNETAYGVQTPGADGEVKLMDTVPLFILHALVRCPDTMEGNNGRKIEEGEDLDLDQALLIMVADREACEDGWVLLIALNHRGQMLHKRSRCKALDVGLQIAFGRDGRQPLDIERCGENVVECLNSTSSGDR